MVTLHKVELEQIEDSPIRYNLTIDGRSIQATRIAMFAGVGDIPIMRVELMMIPNLNGEMRVRIGENERQMLIDMGWKEPEDDDE
jgi:hypothetical protein